MKNKMFNFASWVVADPRRFFVIMTVILIVMTLALAATTPHGLALAEDAVGGS